VFTDLTSVMRTETMLSRPTVPRLSIKAGVWSMATGEARTEVTANNAKEASPKIEAFMVLVWRLETGGVEIGN